nr:glycoside hydrolase family 99-like domain-containing protein [Bauldia sp.]
RAQPQFAGRYQPNVPADLGYYVLRVPAVQHAQIDMARQYGIDAFCFYFYWFAGRRLLEMPLETFADDPEKDFPFCICWANENWTRRWDGRDEDVLVAQDHSPEDDLAFIAYVARYLRNPRYVRVEGRPLLIVYRPQILPEPAATAERWRQWCRENGVGEIHLAYTQSFGQVDPATFGFDAAIEFPPNATGVRRLRDVVEPLGPDFESKTYDMMDLVGRSRAYRPSPYRLYRGVSPSWDNTARKSNRGTVLLNATPEGYREWVGNAVADMGKRYPNHTDHQLVFINAWNEWAEGAHLEPDQRYGFAWLAATRNGMSDVRLRDNPRRIVLVAHDAHEHGAQMLSASIAGTLARTYGMAVDIVLLEGGPLAWRFEEAGTVHRLTETDHGGREATELARRLAASGARTAIVNTSVSGRFLETLAKAGIRCISLVHEMAVYLGQRKLEKHAAAIARHASTVIFGAEAVRRSFATVVPEIARHPDTRIRAQGLYKRNAFLAERDIARRRLRAQLGVAETTPIVLAVGFADHRKGADLFVEAGLRVAEATDAHFVWVGRYGEGMQPAITKRLAASPFGDRFHFVGFKENTDLYYAGADIYALTSREDPLPTVAFEAMDVGVPVIAFEGAGGIPDWLRDGAGVVVPMADVTALAAEMRALVEDPARRRAIGATGQKIVHERLDFAGYVGELLDILGQRPPRISVIVPNYNYARHLRQRLDSILGQTFPIFELIVLDDASTDDSLAVIDATLAGWDGTTRVVVNQTNSGSVFAQWRRGAELARGDLVWIAEADDTASPGFLDAVIARMEAAGAALGFSDSFQIDGDGRRIGRSYARYCDDGTQGRFHGDFTLDGATFLRECLSIKNTILNVSAVVWRREALMQALAAAEPRLAGFRTAGDWLLYVELMRANASVAYVGRSLNGHRRHATSVSRVLDRRRHLDEIVAMHRLIAGYLGDGAALEPRMRTYEDQIAAMFGLDAAEADRPEPSPAEAAGAGGG